MFVRKKNNPSGVVSIQVIDKSRCKYKVVITIGSSSDANEIEALYEQVKNWIWQQKCERDMFLEHARSCDEKELVNSLLNKVENIFSTARN